MKQKTGRLAGKIAVITGVSRARGIGSAIARAFALEGADIFFTHWTSYDRLQPYGEDKEWPEKLAEELREISHMWQRRELYPLLRYRWQQSWLH